MSGPDKFFADLAAHAAAAERGAEIVETSYRIAGLTLRIRFLGRALPPVICPALAHRRIHELKSPADLTLTCWDCETLGQPYPTAPVGKDAFLPRGEVRTLSDARFHTAFEPAGRLLSMMDKVAGEAFYCVGEASQIPRFDRAEPIRSILSWFMRAHDRQLVHAAAVGRTGGGVLLMGRSGAGKSNTSLTCLADGMGFVADDFCIVSADPQPWVHSLYCTAKTRPSDAERSPFLLSMAPQPDPTGRDKTIHDLLSATPDRLLDGFPIRALLLVEQGGSSCQIAPVAASAALAASAPDTARLLADAGPEVLRTLGQIVRRAPCYRLILGPDPHAIAPTILSLLDTLGSAADAA